MMLPTSGHSVKLVKIDKLLLDGVQFAGGGVRKVLNAQGTVLLEYVPTFKRWDRNIIKARLVHDLAILAFKAVQRPNSMERGIYVELERDVLLPMMVRSQHQSFYAEQAKDRKHYDTVYNDLRKCLGKRGVNFDTHRLFFYWELVVAPAPEQPEELPQG